MKSRVRVIHPPDQTGHRFELSHPAHAFRPKFATWALAMRFANSWAQQ